ncbi:glycine cleavage system aminomethyltransferase GcvT [soil metagenome]
MKTPFYDLHLSSGAKIVNFHGWDMPLQYSGIVEEHINTRAKVSLFDVSHMGRFEVRGANAYDLLQTLITNDLSKLDDNQALYSPICYDDGGIIDDLIIYRINSERYLVVVNASNRTKDFQWITSRSEFSADVKDISDATALLALQGPRAQDVLQQALPDLDFKDLKPFDLIKTNISDFGQDSADKKHDVEKQKENGEHFKQQEPELQYEAKEQEGKNELIISRTGYTGEDGFELFFDSSRIDIWEKLIQIGAPFNIKPAGLGARDTLRLEAGLMLYGSDMDNTTTPLEVPLKWTVKLEKPSFIGKQALVTRPIFKKLVGFEVLEKRIARHGNNVHIDGQTAGLVTSGSYSPTLKKSIGFCSVPLNVSADRVIEIDIGGKMYEAKITPTTRFYKRK